MSAVQQVAAKSASAATTPVARRFLSLASGVDLGRQTAWLAERHVHRQEPCSECWARYLCGGGCHHEAIRRGRPACDYIRGWLHHCIEVYLRLPRRRFAAAEVAPPGP